MTDMSKADSVDSPSYVLITIAHLRMAKETGASRAMLVLALITTSVAILLFVWYTLKTAPANLRHPGGDDRAGLGGRGDLAEHQQAAVEERGSVKSELGPATRQLFAPDGLIPANPMAPLRTTQ